MSIYQWQIFMTVAEQKSFVRAAKLLNLSPSAVSHMIAKMEAEYGYTLFIRARNSVELTTNGNVLLPYIRNLLQCNDSLSQKISSLQSATSGVVRVAAFNSVTLNWMPEILRKFKTDFPNIKVTIYQSGDLAIKKWIDSGAVDLAFISTGLMDSASLLLLHKTPLVCVTPKSFVPLNGHLPLESDYRIEVDATCHAYVESGFGFFITPKMAIINSENVAIYPLIPTIYRTVGLATVYPEYISPAAKLLRKYIFQFVSDSGLMNV